MGLKCERYCINQIESVCHECDHSMIRGTICELCGAIKYTSECYCETLDNEEQQTTRHLHHLALICDEQALQHKAEADHYHNIQLAGKEGER